MQKFKQLFTGSGVQTGYFSLKDMDGRPAFAIPVERSSKSFSNLLELDDISFFQFLRGNQYRTPQFLWVVVLLFCLLYLFYLIFRLMDYYTRDEFGCNINDTSGWAGVHYFAARDNGSLSSSIHF